VVDLHASWDKWPDLIAAIHDMRLELVDQEGPRRFRDSFLMMIAESRICWQRALEEKDDVNEWLPNPNQKGPRGLTVTRDQIDGWFKVLDELEAVARGKKLLPHWRIKAPFGINLDRLVAAPPKLDLVLWIQGSAFLPYLEEGPVSDAETWRKLTGPFGPGFFQFAIWSNQPNASDEQLRVLCKCHDRFKLEAKATLAFVPEQQSQSSILGLVAFPRLREAP
jgi:hypothetical protein